jgi:ubiquitin C-terminal hydrolase
MSYLANAKNHWNNIRGHQSNVKGTCGLNNLGNTCYLNSALQCLSNSKMFKDYLVNKEFYDDLSQRITLDNKDSNMCLAIMKHKIKNTLTYTLYDVLRNLWENSDRAFSPVSFRKRFGQIDTIFLGYMQNDSQEALTRIFNTLEDELKLNVKINYAEVDDEFNKFIESYDEEENKLTLKQQHPDLAMKHDLKEIIVRLFEKNYSSFFGIFSGIESNSKKCSECGNVTQIFQKYNIFSVSLPTAAKTTEETKLDQKVQQQKRESRYVNKSIASGKDFLEKIKLLDKPNLFKKEQAQSQTYGYGSMHNYNKYKINKKMIDNNQYTLYECLRTYSESEILDGDNKYNCDICAKKVKAESYSNIVRTPKIISIHLKRFQTIVHANHTVTNLKKKNLINFPIEGLCFDEFVDPKWRTSKKQYYDLVGIINHASGSRGIDSGHYYSYCKNEHSGKWYEFNDTFVKQMSVKDVVKPEAYILFYELRE